MTINDLEIQRLELVKIARYNLIARILLAFFLLILVLFFGLLHIYAFMIYIPLYTASLAWFWRYYNIFLKDFKNTIIRDLIRQDFSNSIFQPEKHIESHLFDQSLLFNKNYDNYTGEDMISFGDYGNLVVSEINASRQESYTDGEGKTQTRTVDIFKGLFGIATFPFVFEGITTVTPRNWLSGIAQFEEVKLESPRFMEIWSVRSTSQIGARMALSTDIMNNLLYFKENNKNKNLSISFVGNQIFVAIDQKTFLKPNYKISVFDQESVKKLKEELSVIQNIIDTFKLRQSENNPTSEHIRNYQFSNTQNMTHLQQLKNTQNKSNKPQSNKLAIYIAVGLIVSILVLGSQVNSYLSGDKVKIDVNTNDQQAKPTDQTWSLPKAEKAKIFSSRQILQDSKNNYFIADQNNTQIGGNKYNDLKKLDSPYENLFLGKRSFVESSIAGKFLKTIWSSFFFLNPTIGLNSNDPTYEVLIDINGNEIANDKSILNVSFKKKYVKKQIVDFDDYIKNYPESILPIKEFVNNELTVEFKQGFGKIDQNGQFILAPYLYRVDSFKEGLGVTRIGDQSFEKYGFVNAQGNIIIPAIFDGAESFKDGFAVVKTYLDKKKSNDRYSFIDKMGKIITEDRVDVGILGEFTNGFAKVSIQYSDFDQARYGSKSYAGIIDKTGKVILDVKNYNIERLENEVIVIYNNKYNSPSEIRYGLMNYLGKVLIEPKFISIGVFDSDIASFVDQSGKDGKIDSKGEIISQPLYNSITQLANNLYVFETSSKLKGLKDGNDMILIAPGNYSKFKIQDDKTIKVIQNGFSDFEIYDFEGNKLLGTRGKNAIVDGMRRYISGSKFGFSKDNGFTAIQAIYADARDFSEGLAAVALTEDGAYGFVDKNGKMIIEPKFDSATSFKNGQSIVTQKYYINGESKVKYGVIDTTGKFVTQPQDQETPK